MSKVPLDAKCGGCRWWDKKPNSVAAECIRYPPTVIWDADRQCPTTFTPELWGDSKACGEWEGVSDEAR